MKPNTAQDIRKRIFCDRFLQHRNKSFSTSSTAFRCFRTGELVLISNTMPFLRNVQLYDLFANKRDYE